MSHSVKSIREQFKAKGVFYTSPELARLLKSYIPEDADCVYDPTCGDGALLDVFPDHVAKYGQELDPQQAQIASERLRGDVHIAAGDTLMSPAFLDRRFRCIVANPPFSVKWHPESVRPDDARFCAAPCLPPASKADYAFLLHILHMLDDGGVAATLNFPGILYRGQREGKIRRWMVEQNVIDEVVAIEGKHFEDTAIATAIVIFRKGRTTTDITFRDNLTQQFRNVPFEEIKANDFNLSVNAYVLPPEPEKPPFNPYDAEMRARSKALKYIRAQIEFSKMVAEFEGWSLNQFLDDIADLVNEYRAVSTTYNK